MSSTINDVAKEAGVSITTVSRVINNNYPVKQETRERIENAIEKLNYKPNIAARSLITKKTSTIAVVVPGITNLFFPAIVENIEKTVKELGYSVLLCNTGGDFNEERVIIENLISRHVDGFVFIDPSIENLNNGYIEKMSRENTSIVIKGLGGSYKCNFVSYDEEIGTKEAFKYLYSLGHRKIAFLRGYKSFSYDIKENVYRQFLMENNLEYTKIIKCYKGNTLEVIENVENEMKKIFTEETPTAVFACNEMMAIGVMNLCTKMKINIPKELSVIGCDNTLLSSITHPKLTSVDLKIKDIGVTAAKELMNMMNNNVNIRRQLVVDTELIVRDSCAQVVK